MKKIYIIVTSFLLILVNNNALANCYASPLSTPDDLFGQTFDCSDGSSFTYQRGILGDSITNNKTGDVFSPSLLTDTNDEYGTFGRGFDNGTDSLTINRGILGDSLFQD